MLCYLSPVQCYQSLKRRCWWLQEKVGAPKLNNVVLARFDESRQGRKLVAPFLCKDSSSVLICLVFLRSSGWQDLVSLQWGEVLWACCQCSLQLSTACWAQKKRSWGKAAPWGGGGEEPLKIRSWRSRGHHVREREQCMLSGFDSLISGGSVTQTNSSSNLNSAPRCEEWGILGHWVQFRVHFEIHNEWLHLWVPTSLLWSQDAAWCGILRATTHMYNP